MKRMTLGIIIGLVAGLLLAILIFYLSAPRLMFKETPSELSFEETVSKLESEITKKGWKIPEIHDLQATLKKFEKDVNSVKVFEICHPDLSFRILSRNEERIVSNMMPCRIAVYERSDGSVWISRMNSGLVAKPLGKVVRQTMTDAAAQVEEIIAEVDKK